jgi:glycosyltransferase involved in cell wall biosynthesis
MINLVAPCNTLGYGVTSLNILRSLSKLTDVAYWPIGQVQISTEEEQADVVAAMENTKIYDKNAPCIRIWHQHDLAQFVGKGEHVGFPIFELDSFNKVELHHLASCDKLFVCSEWAKEVVKNNLTQYTANHYDTHVIPLGVDTSLFKPAVSEHDRTIFFNCGKWEVRKGHDILIKAFIEAFKPEDEVELWLMCDNPFNTDKEDREWYSLFDSSELYMKDKIKLIPRVKTHREVYNIMRQTDCGVFPARAEGWNLEALEMLACGKQLIITDYSAHSEFCNSSNTYLLPVTEKELAFDNKWFFGQGSWAKLDNVTKRLVIAWMREVHSDKQAGRLKMNIHGVETAQKFTWENSAKRIIECLND